MQKSLTIYFNNSITKVIYIIFKWKIIKTRYFYK